MDTFVEILRLGAVGLIAGLFSSYLAANDHRSKKWWELRVAAYQSVIEALSDLYYYFDRHLVAETEYRELSEESRARLSKFWDEGYHKVRKAADAGAFLFSDEANAALIEFVKSQDEHHEAYWESLDAGYGAARTCLDTLVKCSKKDLRLERRWL